MQDAWAFWLIVGALVGAAIVGVALRALGY